MSGVDIVVAQPGKTKSLWMSYWSLVNYPLFFIFWWFNGFVPYLARITRRLVIGGWQYLSLGMLLKRFFAPWKNVDNIAGWFTGIAIKLIYFVIVFPMWFAYAVVLYAFLLFLVFIWIVPILIWFLKQSGSSLG